MDVNYWLGVVTPFAVILATGLCWLLLIGLRWLNGRVHDRFTKRFAFIDIRTDDFGVETYTTAVPNGGGHDRQAEELTRVIAAAPGYRMFRFGPWRIVIVHDYTTEETEPEY